MMSSKNPIKALHQEFLTSNEVEKRTAIFKLWLEAIVKFNLSVHVGWLLKNRSNNVPDNIKVQLINLFQKPPSIGVCLSLSRLINRVFPNRESTQSRLQEFRALFELYDSIFSELLEIRNAEAHSTRMITSFDLDKIQDYMNRISNNPFYTTEIIPISIDQYIEAKDNAMFDKLSPSTFDNRKLPVLAGSGNYIQGKRLGEDDIVLFPIAIFDSNDKLFLWNKRSGSGGKYSSYSFDSESLAINNITDISGFPYDDWKRAANPIYLKYLELRARALDELPADNSIAIREIFDELNLARRLEVEAQINEYERITELQFLGTLYSRLKLVNVKSEKLYFWELIINRIDKIKVDGQDETRRLWEIQLLVLLDLIRDEIDNKSFSKASDHSIYFLKKYISFSKSFNSVRNYSYYILEFERIGKFYLSSGRSKFQRTLEIATFYLIFSSGIGAVYSFMLGENSFGFIFSFLALIFLFITSMLTRSTFQMFLKEIKLDEIFFNSAHQFKLNVVFRFAFKYLSIGTKVKSNFGIINLMLMKSGSLKGELIRNGFLLYAPKLIDFEFSGGMQNGIQKLKKIEKKILSASLYSDLDVVLAFRLKIVQWLIERDFFKAAEEMSKISDELWELKRVLNSMDPESIEGKNIARVLLFKFKDDQQSEKIFVLGTMGELLRVKTLMYLWRFEKAEPNEKRKYIDASKEALLNLASGTYRIAWNVDLFTPDVYFMSFMSGNLFSRISSTTEMKLRYLRGFWLINLNEYDLAIKEYEIVYQKSEELIRYFSLWNILQAQLAKKNAIEVHRIFTLLKRLISDLDPELKKGLPGLIHNIHEMSATITESGGDISQLPKKKFFIDIEVLKKISEVKEIKTTN